MTGRQEEGKPLKDAAQATFSRYASYYDILYQDKDYEGEALFVARLIRKLMPEAGGEIRVLDLACGTGRHAMELARLGYQVEGSDLSAEMVKVAVKESKKNRLDIRYYNESFQTAGRIGRKYDVIVSMFSAINYLTSYADLSAALSNIDLLLEENGIFIFDFWNGNAVLNGFSPVRVKKMNHDGTEVIRISETTVDAVLQLATVRFDFMLINNGRVENEFQEEHRVRYYFLQEMADLLRANKFEVIFRCPFMNAAGELTANDWNATYVVRRTA